MSRCKITSNIYSLESTVPYTVESFAGDGKQNYKARIFALYLSSCSRSRSRLAFQILIPLVSKFFMYYTLFFVT